MNAGEVDICERRIQHLRENISSGKLDLRGYDVQCGELRGVEWVLRELYRKPNDPQRQQKGKVEEFVA